MITRELTAQRLKLQAGDYPELDDRLSYASLEVGDQVELTWGDEEEALMPGTEGIVLGFGVFGESTSVLLQIDDLDPIWSRWVNLSRKSPVEASE